MPRSLMRSGSAEDGAVQQRQGQQGRTQSPIQDWNDRIDSFLLMMNLIEIVPMWTARSKMSRPGRLFESTYLAVKNLADPRV